MIARSRWTILAMFILLFSGWLVSWGSPTTVTVKRGTVSAPVLGESLVILETKWAADPNASWQTSGTSICAGGKDSDVHRADVHIVVPDQAKGQVLEIKLIGGAGFNPQRDWWDRDGKATPAALSFDFGTLAPGGTLNTTIGDSPGDLDIEGTLTSSNKVESVTIQVKVANGAAVTTQVDFGAPTYSNNLGDIGFTLSDPRDFAVTVQYNGKPVDQHKLTFVVDTVHHTGTPSMEYARKNGKVYDLTGSTIGSHAWVKIGAAGGPCQEAQETNSDGITTGTCTVVDNTVLDFTILIADLSVAVPTLE